MSQQTNSYFQTFEQGQTARWLVRIAIIVLLSLAAWGGKTLISQGESIATHTAHIEDINKTLTRIEQKVDRILERGR